MLNVFVHERIDNRKFILRQGKDLMRQLVQLYQREICHMSIPVPRL